MTFTAFIKQTLGISKAWTAVWKRSRVGLKEQFSEHLRRVCHCAQDSEILSSASNNSETLHSAMDARHEEQTSASRGRHFTLVFHTRPLAICNNDAFYVWLPSVGEITSTICK